MKFLWTIAIASLLTAHAAHADHHGSIRELGQQFLTTANQLQQEGRNSWGQTSTLPERHLLQHLEALHDAAHRFYEVVDILTPGVIAGPDHVVLIRNVYDQLRLDLFDAERALKDLSTSVLRDHHGSGEVTELMNQCDQLSREIEAVLP